MKIMLKWIILSCILTWSSGAPTDGDDIICKTCHTLVEEVRDLIQGKLPQAAIINYFKDICQKLPSEEKDVCYFFIQNHSEQLFEKLSSDLTPNEICQKLPSGVCLPPDVQLVEEPADEPYREPEEISLQENVEPREITAEENVQGIVECELCKFLCKAVDKFIGSNRSVAAINSTLEKLCNSLPGEIGDLCKQYEPDIVKVIQQGLDPDIACRVIKLCSAGNIGIPCEVCYTATVSIGIKDPEDICSHLSSCQAETEDYEQEQEPVNSPKEKVQDEFDCDVCKFIAEFVEHELNSSKGIAVINSTLMKLCKALPDEKIRSTCIEYEPQVIALIQQGIPPNVVCTMLKACTGSYPYISQGSIPCDVCQSALEAILGSRGIDMCFEIPGICLMPGQLEPAEPEPTRKPVPECEVCQFMVQSVMDQVESFGKDKIVEVFERICGQMPEQEQEFCTKYGSALIRDVMGGVTDSWQSCVKMAVCEPIESEETEQEEPVSMQQKPDGEEMEQEENIEADGKCEVCQLLMLILNQVVKDNKTLVELNTTLFRFCKLLPTKLDLQKIADTRCELCKFSVGLLDEALKKGGPNLNKTLYGACNLVPEQYRQICFQLVPEIEKFAKQGLDPTQACQAVNMCPKTESATLPRHKRSLNGTPVGAIKDVMKDLTSQGKLNGVLECEACKIAVRTLDNLIKENKTEKELNDTVYEICLRLSGEQLVQKCLEAVAKLLPAIMKGLDPDQVCQTIGLCSKDTSGFNDNDSRRTLVKRSVDVKSSDKLEDVKCEICKAVVEFVDSVIEKNASKEKINETVYQFCNSLPGSLKDLCLQYAPDIVNVIEKGVDPQAACQKISLCTSSSGKSKKSKMVSLMIGKNVKDLETDIEPKDTLCDLCKVVVQFVDSVIEKNASKEKINETVYQFCNSLPGAIKDLCLQYAPKIVSVIEKGVDPQKACEEIKLCSSTSGRSEKFELFDMVEKKQVKGSDSEPKDTLCDLCKVVVQFVDSVIEKNASKEKINETVYQFCNSLPGAIKDLCLQYAPKIVSVIEKGVDPQKACEEIKLCSSTSGKSEKLELFDMTESKKEKEPAADDWKCEACKLIVNILDKIIEKNGSIDKINKTIYNFCNSLPAEEKLLCLAVAPLLLNQTAHGFNATVVCGKVGLCNSSLSAPADIKLLELTSDKEDGIECELCKAVIQEVDAVLEKNATFEKINATVFGICNRLPKEYKEIVKACDEIAPRIVALIAGGADPDFICEKLGVCKDITLSKPLPPVIVDRTPMQCGACRTVVETILDDLHENYPKIKRAIISNVCNKLPQLYRPTCNDLSSSDLSIYWKQFLGNYNPTGICEMVGCEEDYYPGYPSEESSGYPSEESSYPSKESNRT